MPRLPALFLSHGSPMLALDKSPAHHFLRAFAKNLPRPRGIIIQSAHYETEKLVVSAPHHAGEVPETLYDFGGFDPALRQITYPAPGAPDLADDIVRRFADKGIPSIRDFQRGYDHGVWVPLSLLYPDADIPIVQVSLVHGADAEENYAIGQALAGLREQGYLLIGSGALTHNLREVFSMMQSGATQEPEWVSAFADWFAETLTGSTPKEILNWQAAPFGRMNHPTPEHILPAMTMLGATLEQSQSFCVDRVHESIEYGALRMDAFALGV